MKWGLNAVRRWNTAQRLLNTEHCEVLEHHEVVIESRVAAFNKSSGTSYRSIASLHSASPPSP